MRFKTYNLAMLSFSGLRSFCLCGLLAAGALSFGQDRWPGMPGYKEYQEALREVRSVQSPNFRARWTSDSVLEYRLGSETKQYDLKSGQTRVTASASLDPTPKPLQQPGRGRQWTKAQSDDGKAVATYRDGNLFLSLDGGAERQITPDGDPAKRIRYGTASWVYGEELDQSHAFGFSPDGKKLWIYRFDDSQVVDYHLTLGQGDQQVSIYSEAYPKPGKGNPIVDLYTYDIASEVLKKVKVRPGQPDNGIGHYVYAISWGEDSQELYFHRMDRRQKVKELCAVNPQSGVVRVVNRTENQSAWVEFMPLADVSVNRRGANPAPMPTKILYRDDSDGFMNLYWLDTKSGQRSQVTRNRGDVISILNRDEAKKRIVYSCADGSTPYRHQIHVVNFDGSGHKQLTNAKHCHTASFNAGAELLAVESENSEEMPRLTLMDLNGRVVKDFGVYPNTDNKGFLPKKWFTAKTFDGKETLYCEMDFPRNFDPKKKYPVLVDVYGGPLPPGWGAPSEQYALSNVQASAGFVVVKIHGRGENGRGRAFRNAIYRNMGIVEIDDQAAGVQALSQFPFIDTDRVGIHGVSYGGYASAMCLLRYPNLFAAASSGSMVSQWTNYDTTYTERYMDLLEENKAGYEAGSCMTYASKLEGWLMLYFGTADDNTHPSNTYQLCEALSRAGKFYELQVGVDRGHTGLNFAREMEFFVERLVMTGPRRMVIPN